MRLKAITGLRAFLSGTSSPATLAQRLKAWRAGFSGTTWLLYDLDNRSPSDYVPDSKASAMAAIDGPVARSVLRNKLLFEKVVGQHVAVPRVLAVHERGAVTALDPRWDVGDAEGVVQAVLETGCPVILKPMDSSEGRGVRSLEVSEGRLLLDKREATPAEAAASVKAADGTLVTEMVWQGGFVGRVFPGALNTVRVITMIDPDDGEPFVASALHRFGTWRSAPTDNVSRGAIRCVVDVDTGRLSQGGASWSYENGEHATFEAHPDTGVPLTGAVLEGWDDVKDTLLRVVRRLPFLVYVGWDVAITEGGIVVVEGNHSPNISQQVAGPYLADPRIKRFLQHHGVT